MPSGSLPRLHRRDAVAALMTLFMLLQGCGGGTEIPAASSTASAMQASLCGLQSTSTPAGTAPMVMNLQSDEEFGRIFFAELDLSSTKYVSARAALAKCDFSGALQAWKQALVDPSGLDALRRLPTQWLMRPPGDISAWMAAAPAVPAALTPPPKALLDAIWAKVNNQGTPVGYGNAELARRWAWYARAFVNDKRSGAYWQKSPATLNDQVTNFAYPFFNLLTLDRQAFLDGVDARSAAEVVYYLLKWPVRKIHEGRYLRQPFPMNQRASVLETELVLLLAVPDLADASPFRAALDADLPRLYGTGAPADSAEVQAYYDAMGTDLGPDGIGSENSYNYAAGVTLPVLQSIADIAAASQPRPKWLDHVEQRLAQAHEAYRHLGTPGGGVLILAKNGRYERRLQAYTPSNPPASAFLSEQFPYHGVFIMRENWTRQSLFLALSNVRRGSGHEAEDANKLHLEAYGQYMLVSNSGERDCCDAGGSGSYFGSSWAQNTINVDDVGMKRVSAARHAAYIDPIESRWHSDAEYDQVASVYRYGWGGRAVGASEQRSVDDVPFTRNVVYLKAMRLWVVVDSLVAPAGASHDYRQVWNFHSSYVAASFQASVSAAGIGTAGTGQADKPNLLIYQLPVAGVVDQPLSYDSYLGAGCTASNDSSLVFSLRDLQPDSRGCMNMGTAYGAYAMDHDNRVLPAPTVHARWRGTGPQVIVSVLAPSPGAAPVVSSLAYIGDAGGGRVYRLTLKSGQSADITVASGATAKDVVSIRADGVSPVVLVPR